MRIVFMGTPDFAVPSLIKIASMDEVELTGVMTQPDRPKGRGQRTSSPSVKKAADDLSIPVYQPPSAKDPGFTEKLYEWNPELVVVVAFGMILPSKVIHLPRYGCVNVHASLLPKYRGAAPIQQCIIDGCSQTGITTMKMDEGLDTGDILLQQTVPVRKNDTALSLQETLAVLGAETLAETIRHLIKKNLHPIQQNEMEASYAPRLSKNSGCIDWSQEACTIDCLVRGTLPWPGAYTFYKGKVMKIWDVNVMDGESVEHPGVVLGVDRDGIRVSAGKGTVVIRELQAEGKKRMSAGEYVKGNQVEPFSRMGR